MDRSALYFGGIMIGAFFTTAVINQIVPPPYSQYLGGGAYFLIIILGFFGMDLMQRERTNKFPSLKMIIRPYNEEKYLFIDYPKSGSAPKTTGANEYATTLQLAFPIKIEKYGDTEIRQLRINHSYPWKQRIAFRPGKTKMDDLEIDHPATETIIVDQTQSGNTAIEKSQAIPIFRLINARDDMALHVPQRVDAVNTENADIISEKLRNTEDQLNQALGERDYYHREFLEKDQVVKQDKIEIEGLLSLIDKLKHNATQIFLTFIQACGTIDSAYKAYSGNKFMDASKWLAIGFVAAVGIAYLWSNPQMVQGIGLWFSERNNQFLVIGIGAIAVIGIYYYSRRRG